MKGKKGAKGSFFAFSLLLIIFLSASYAFAAEVQLGIRINPLQLNETGIGSVNASVVLNSTGNASISVPVSYVGTGLFNMSISKPSNWTNGVGWYVLEDSVRKNLTVSGNNLEWEANRSAASVQLYFEVPPPQITSANETVVNATFFEKNITVTADNHFSNVSANVSVNSSYGFWTLWHYESSGFVDKSVMFNLQVISGYAIWSNFSTSTQLFRLTGNATCTESWSCSDWSDSANNCGTRTCTDSNHCGTAISKPSESANCAAAAASGSGGGGGGGGGGAAAGVAGPDFELSPDLIRVELRGDRISKKTIEVRNTGSTALDLKIDLGSTAGFVISPGGARRFDMSLAPGQARSFDIIIFGSDVKPGTHSGNIIVSGAGIEKTVSVVLDHESEKPLFDVELNVPERYSKVFPGDDVFAEITLFNLRGLGKVDVAVNYSIIGPEGKVLSHGSTTVAVETQASFVRNLAVPSGAKPGRYVFSVETESEGITAVGSDVFEVVEKPVFSARIFTSSNLIFLGIGMLIAVLMLVIGLSVFDMLHHHRIIGPKPAEEKKAVKEELGEDELRRQLKVLEAGFESGVISARAYIEDKSRIEKLLKSFRKQ